ncbi:MAG: hypothetical protein AB1805_00710 [Nitrospirota bacterium]
MSNEEVIIREIREISTRYKSMVVSGEEGVGKITNTLSALRNNDHVYYIGNPVDYIGKPRPKGYDKYINYITTLKHDMTIMAEESEILALPSLLPSDREATLIIDEVFGRSEAQYDTLSELLGRDPVKAFLITGCLKNIGRLVHHIDAVLMLTQDGVLVFDKEFARQVCAVLRPEAL